MEDMLQTDLLSYKYNLRRDSKYLVDKVECYRFKDVESNLKNKYTFVPVDDINEVDNFNRSKVISEVPENEVNLTKYGLKSSKKHGGSRKKPKTHKSSKARRH